MKESIQAMIAELNQELGDLMSLVRTRSQQGLFQAEPLALAQRLTQHVVFGEKVQAEIILRAHPELALFPCEVVDYSGRIIATNALRASLGAINPGMWKMIMGYVCKNKNADFIDTLRENFTSQFPEGVTKPQFFRQGEVIIHPGNYDFKEIVRVINEASNEEISAFLDHADDPDFASRLSQPFAEFRRYFSPEKIEAGAHFNAQNLRNAFNIYNGFGNELGMELKHGLPRKLFYRMVIGYIERFVPAHYAQAFCQGLFDVVDGNNPIVQSMFFKYYNDNNIRYYPLDQHKDMKLGYQVASDYSGTPPDGKCEHYGEGAAGTPWMLQLEAFDIYNRHELWKLSCELGLNRQHEVDETKELRLMM